MTKFKTLIPLLASVPIMLSSAKINQNSQNDETPNPYNHYLLTNYTPAEYVRLFELDINMNDYADSYDGRAFVPFYKLDKSINLGYELYYTNQEGDEIVFLSGVHTKAQSAALPESGLYSITGYFPIEFMGERATFTFRFYDLSNRYDQHYINFYLSAPGIVRHTGRYARIFYRVIMSNNQIFNYEDRVDFDLLANEYICDYYIKIPISSFRIKCYGLQSNMCDEAFFLLYDNCGYLDTLMSYMNDHDGYAYLDLELTQIPSSRTYKMEINQTYYLNQDTFVSDYVKKNPNDIAVDDIYLPIQKYEEYKVIPCGLFLVNFGRSKTTIFHTFDLVFEKKYIYDAIISSRVPGGTPYRPTMTEHFI